MIGASLGLSAWREILAELTSNYVSLPLRGLADQLAAPIFLEAQNVSSNRASREYQSCDLEGIHHRGVITRSLRHGVELTSQC